MYVAAVSQLLSCIDPCPRHGGCTGVAVNTFICCYLNTLQKNQNLFQEEIKRRLNSGKACCHSVQNLLYFRPLSNNIKIRIYETIILPVVLYGCETLSLTLREEHRLWVFEKRVFRRISGSKRDEGENCIMKSFITCTLFQV
jgi:hypothetical protein